MKTVIIALYKTYPPTSGAAAVSYHFARNLSGEKYYFQLGDSDRVWEEGRLQCVDFCGVSHRHCVKAAALFCRFFSLARKVRALAPDCIVFEGASWAFYYAVFLYVLRGMGVRAKVVYHAHNVEYMLRRQKNNRFVANLTRLSEKTLVRKSDIVTAVSAKDAGDFRRLYNASAMIVPNGVDMRSFDRIPQARLSAMRQKYGLRGTIILFMGMIAFKPNREALDFLLRRIFPRLHADYPQARLAVIGGTTNTRFPWLINPGVIPFEEVPAFIKACDIGVAPLFTGSGTRLKILEYLAAAKPVVATTKGAEGLDLKHNKHILIADKPDDFLAQLRYLIMFPEAAQVLGREGKLFVERTYAWPVIMRGFNSQVGRVLHDSAAMSPARTGCRAVLSTAAEG